MITACCVFTLLLMMLRNLDKIWFSQNPKMELKEKNQSLKAKRPKIRIFGPN